MIRHLSVLSLILAVTAAEFGEKMAAGNPDNTDLQEIMDNLVAGITQSVAE